MAHRFNSTAALFLEEDRPFIVTTGASCDTTVSLLVAVTSLVYSNAVMFKSGPSSQQQMTKAIDYLLINRFPKLPSSSAQVSLQFR